MKHTVRVAHADAVTTGVAVDVEVVVALAALVVLDIRDLITAHPITDITVVVVEAGAHGDA
jgi:hypothetical protein